MADEEHDTFLILAQHGVERGIVCRTHPSVDALRTLRTVRRTHHDGTQGGTKRQCRNHGDAHRRCHRNAELRIEHTRSTAHKRHGDKHRHEHAGTRDDSHRHIAHRILRGKVGRLISGVELGLHSLHHHDGIVHHRTDGKHQRKQRQDVETEPRSHQAGKRTDQRHDDGDGRYKRTLEVLQEEVHYQNHQDNGNDQRLHHIVYGSEEEVVGAHHRHKLRPFGQALPHLVYLCGNLLVDGGCVGACRLEHHEKYSRLAVHLTAETVSQRAQRHIRHVLQTEHGTVALRTDHRVLEFLHTLQASAIFHRKLEYVL